MHILVHVKTSSLPGRESNRPRMRRENVRNCYFHNLAGNTAPWMLISSAEHSSSGFEKTHRGMRARKKLHRPQAPPNLSQSVVKKIFRITHICCFQPQVILGSRIFRIPGPRCFWAVQNFQDKGNTTRVRWLRLWLSNSYQPGF